MSYDNNVYFLARELSRLTGDLRLATPTNYETNPFCDRRSHLQFSNLQLTIF